MLFLKKSVDAVYGGNVSECHVCTRPKKKRAEFGYVLVCVSFMRIYQYVCAFVCMCVYLTNCLII